MIIFPFGFYILEGNRPTYIGNDLEAQKTVRAWIEANPERVRLRFDVVGPTQVLTKFLGWNDGVRSSSMALKPLLFETTLVVDLERATRQFHSDYDAALACHAELVQLAKNRLH
jgi:hypothetical protein